MNVRLTFLYQTRAPLSHIGESISTETYLVQHPILQPDGRIEEVFAYSGNAVRGQWRDLAAIYMLEKLGNARVPLEIFHLLFSGGKIGGDQKNDIAALRAFRSTLPCFSIFGGGVGNQIIPGKLRVSCLYPLCREAIPMLPDDLHDKARGIEYRGMTFQAHYARKDDSKDVRLLPNLAEAESLALEGNGGKRKPDDEVKQQMRMTSELLAPGVLLYGECDCLDITEIEMGALVSALHAFSRSPVLGGQGNKGHGRVSADIRYTDLHTGETRDFMQIKAAGMPLLAPVAEKAKASYDQFLRAQYDAMLSGQQAEIRKLLGAA